MEVLSIVTNISRYGGAQKVMMDIHHGLKGQLSSKILSLQAFDTVHPQYFCLKRTLYVLGILCNLIIKQF